MRYLILLFIVVIMSCQNIERMAKPDNLIPQGKMINVMTEISLYDAAKRLRSRDVRLIDSTFRPYLYKKYNIDSLQLINSNRYYSEHIETYKEIFDSVQARMDKLKVKLDTILARERRANDSLNSTDETSGITVDALEGYSGMTRKVADSI